MFSNSNFFVEKHTNPPFQSNTYIIYSKNNKIIAIIDPGESIYEKVNCENLNVILTHEHFDHISGLQKLSTNFFVKLFLSQKCRENINNSKINLSEYILKNKIDEILPSNFKIVDDNELIIINDLAFRFYITPGHSEGGICIGFDKYIITGDTILNSKKIVTNLPGGSKEQLKNTNIKLKYILKNYDYILPGHGEIFPVSYLYL
jgi:glyoxylase-like metal-dependent hydrolase (beta-lactamase superfamily II)